MFDELLRQCATARIAGFDYYTIWLTILRIHPLVGGSLCERVDGLRRWLEVPLVSGARLIMDEGSGLRIEQP